MFACIWYNIQDGYYNKNKTKNIYKCFSNTMSTYEEDILIQLIQIWDKVSQELNITWSVCAGSYIGVKRHKGRIPWDDDFDITILQKDVIKFDKLQEKLEPYKVSLSRFWGGFKINFNDSRAINKFTKYKWSWPFIDIFAIHKDANCSFIEKGELPIKKEKFGKILVNVYQNPSKKRLIIRNTNWKTIKMDSAYRHQLESWIGTCSKKKI